MAQRLSWWRAEYRDPYEPRYYTAVTCTVMAPNLQRPYVSVLITIANAAGMVKLRVRDIVEARSVIAIPDHAAGKLQAAVDKGNRQADQIERDLRVMFERRKLPEGEGLARTDTGEIVAEADKAVAEVERIMKESNGD